MPLTGPGGLLGRLAKVVLESALEAGMDGHLGYRKHEAAGDGSGNSRNGHRAKTVLTGAGPVPVSVPRDRESSFAPVIVPKRARRLGGIDDMVISLVAKGLATGEVRAHLAEIYGAEVSRETISTITDRVLAGLAGWQSRPLEPVYAVLFLDAIQVKITDGQVANRPIYVALGVTAGGERGILGLRATTSGPASPESPAGVSRHPYRNTSSSRCCDDRLNPPTALAAWLPVLPGLTPHGLRHGHQTWMEEAGVSDLLRSERMGHEVPDMRGVYGHVTPAMRAALTAMLQERWEASLRERARLSARSIVPVLDALLTVQREPTTKIGSHFAPKIGHQRATRLAERKTDGH